MSETKRPLLFLDVDGVLNPDSTSVGRRPPGYLTHRMRPSGYNHPRQKPLRVWLDPGHGRYLKALGYDLVWATAWEHEANEWIAPHVGLPELPVVKFTTPIKRNADFTHWKLRDLLTYAGGREFAWVDDEINKHDGEYVRQNYPHRTLLLQVAPLVGLESRHFAELQNWARWLETEPAA